MSLIAFIPRSLGWKGRAFHVCRASSFPCGKPPAASKPPRASFGGKRVLSGLPITHDFCSAYRPGIEEVCSGTLKTAYSGSCGRSYYPLQVRPRDTGGDSQNRQNSADFKRHDKPYLTGNKRSRHLGLEGI